MATLWLTYAWNDNRHKDVDFIVQELIQQNLTVKLDRWNLQAGKPLWDQIASFITDPSQSDAWVLYATQTSLSSPACQEELRLALDRAINSRGETFPVIALFPAQIERSLIPPAVRIRLYVSTTDPDWKERIQAAAEKRHLDIAHQQIEPYSCKMHQPDAKAIQDGYQHVIEVRPRAGVWSPFFAAIPKGEEGRVGFTINLGTPDRVPGLPVMILGFKRGASGDWYLESRETEATPTRSYYIYCRELPSILAFGSEGREPQYRMTFG